MSTGTGNIWLCAGLGLVGIALVAPTMRRDDGPPPETRAEAPRSAPSAAPRPAAAPGVASRALTRDADGHFYAEAQVNGAYIRFMIDTGATMVALTPADAQRAGIALPSERQTARGAGGEIEVIPVTIDRIAMGSLEARNVRGAVARELPVSLLGQSFLSEVGTVEISGDRMVLR